MSVVVDPESPSRVEHMVNDFITKRTRAFTTHLRTVSPQECFQAITNDKTHTILLLTEDQLPIDEKMVESATKLHDEAVKRVMGLKRIATDDISDAHPRKMR